MLFRSRPFADLSINGSWLLLDGSSAWFVSAEGSTTVVHEGIPAVEPESIIEGDRRALVGLLLGRVPPDELELSGNIVLATAIKHAFPGP